MVITMIAAWRVSKRKMRALSWPTQNARMRPSDPASTGSPASDVT